MKSNVAKDNGSESIKEAARHLAHDASADAMELGGDLARLRDEIVNAVKHALASAREGARDRVSHVYESAVDRSSEAASNLSKTVKENPLTSIAVATGVGMMLGLFMRRRH